MAEIKLNSRSDFLWGVCMHTPGFGGAYKEKNLEYLVHSAAKMGARLIRIDAYGTTLAHLDKAVRLANAYKMKVMIIVGIDGFERRIVEKVGYTAPLEERFKLFAERYNGKNGFGKVDFIQIHNEMDIWINNAQYINRSAPDGDSIEDWNEQYLSNVAIHVKAAIDGVKSADTDIKTVINFSWLHYGMLRYFKEYGIDWDVTGHDWYEDMMIAVKNKGAASSYEVGKWLYDEFKKPIIICESNLWKNEPFDYNDLSNWQELIGCMKDAYSREYVIGYTFYELCDQPARDRNGWDREGHFGMLICDKQGESLQEKAIYKKIQYIIGGDETVKMADWQKISKSTSTNLHIPL